MSADIKEVEPKREHGTTKSYVIGFLLSLVFTAIPYYLVVNKTVTGNSLLAIILGFAVLQMIIQIVFFLHLGREPKPHYNLLFFVSTVGIILVVVLGSIFIMNHLHYNMAPTEVSKKLAEDEGIYQLGGEKTGACRGSYTNYRVLIKDGKLSPRHTKAQLCDRLTFINQDSDTYNFLFGVSPEQGTYAGETGIAARKGRAKTLILNQSGTYRFYDSTDPKTTGDFTVAPNPSLSE